MCGCQLIGIIEIQSLFTGIAGHRFQILGSERDLLDTAVNKKVFHEISEQFSSLQSMEYDPDGVQCKIRDTDAIGGNGVEKPSCSRCILLSEQSLQPNIGIDQKPHLARHSIAFF